MSADLYSTPQSHLEVNPDALSLHRVAQAQRALLLAILGSFLGIALPALLRLPIGLLCAVLMFRLARELYSRPVALALAVASFIPLLGLIALLAVNQRATRALRAAGFRVGLLGARVPAAETSAAK